MRFFNKFFIFLFGHILARNINAVPVSVINNDISNGMDDEGDEETNVLDEDDNTTHGLERLSSAATCLVAGVEYTHGQQIYRKDPCEFCLCLDGEMFCWWQDCPPTMEGPCKDRGPFSACLSVPSSMQPSSSTSASSTTPYSQKQTTTTTTTQQQNILSSTITLENANNTEDFSIENSTVDDDDDDGSENVYSSEMPHPSSTEEAQRCIVMGREYKIGDKLPHDTGNCIECVCGQGAKLSCSPHQCAPVGDDINDYRPPGPRQPLPDVF